MGSGVGIRYVGVEKTFGEAVALRSLDLAVPEGRFLVLLGPSGCGKTTALRILAGLETPTAGTVRIGDRDVTGLPPRARDVAMVFQSYALYPHMSVGENVGYPLKIRGLSRDERKRRVTEVATSLEIDHLLERRPRQLSGGQRQRVALARAIVREPAAFLMDEPLSNLDAKLRMSTRGEIKRLQKQLGVTTLYVTHDQSEATTMADLVAVMRDGDLQQLASPGEIYDRPANRFVATFVGSPPMSVLDGAMDGEDFVVTGADARLRLPSEIAAECLERQAVAIGVRPEDLALTEPGAPGSLPGSVFVVEPMGSETLVDVTVGETRVVVRAPRATSYPLGAAVGLAADARRACFFAADGTTVVHRRDIARPD
jgi:multiple sugar transport system ATP-binding protein